MCGIAMILSKHPVEGRRIKAMTDAIRHRGPDDSGFLGVNTTNGNVRQFVDEDSSVGGNPVGESDDNHLLLGHRRLSIIDLSASGRQPQCYLNRYWIVFNGEIYNYLELKRELAADGYQFNTMSDTEVIMASYHKWGSGCVSRFNGMWAFIIYDTEKKNLFISRDRLGKKPLYWYHDKNYFLLASEIKSILAVPGVKKAPNLSYCRKFLKKGAMEYLSETAFEGIYKFHYAGFSEVHVEDLQDHKKFEQQIFWNIKPNLDIPAFNQKEAEKLSRQYLEILKDAVKIRLRSDVKVGSALSGGLDSSGIVCLINEILKESGGSHEIQETFSNIYKDKNAKDCDESEFIKTLSKWLNVKSNLIEPETANIAEEHRRMIYMMDTPPESTLMSGWHTFKLVKMNHIKVTLDGQGADEQLGGYLYYIINYLLTVSSNSPLGRAAGGLNYKSSRSEFEKIIGKDHPVLKRADKFYFIKKILPEFVINAIIKFTNKEANPFVHLNQLFAKNMFTRFMNLIHFQDRYSMAHSVESRLPFLDYRLVEFLSSVPVTYKLHNGWTKHLARLAMNGKLPDEITWRKDKMGWEMPNEYWFRGPLKEWFCKTIESSPFWKLLGINHEIRKKIDSDTDIEKLILYLNLAVWYDIFFSDSKD